MKQSKDIFASIIKFQCLYLFFCFYRISNIALIIKGQSKENNPTYLFLFNQPDNMDKMKWFQK